MSVKLAEGVVEVTADTSRVPASVAASLSGADPTIAAAGGRSGRSFVRGLGVAAAAGGALAIGVGIGGLISDGVRQGFDFSLEGIGLASDLTETRAAIGEVFEGGAAEVEDFASRANRALGQTQQQALNGARTFGIFGRAAGLSGGELSGFSTGLVTLASDLASFNNTSPEEAIVAIGAALRGESEPIRAYGVLLDEATLRQRAFTLGLIETTNEALTPQQRVLAAQAEIYAQTSTQQGDFARTSGGLANQQRILAASFEEVQTKLGQYLMPGFMSLVSVANEDILPAFGSIIDRVGPDLGAALEAVDWAGFAEDIAPSIERIGQLTAEEGIPNLVRLLEGLAEVSPVVFESVNNDLDTLSDGLDIFQGDWSALRDANPWLEEIGIILADGEVLFGDAGVDFMESLELGVLDAAGGPQGAVAAALRGMHAAAYRETEIGTRRGGGGSFDAGVAVGDGLASGVATTGSKVNAAAARLARGISGTIRTELNIQSPSRVMASIGGFAGEGLAEGVLGKESKVKGAALALSTALVDAMPGALDLSATVGGRPVGGFGAPEAFAAPSGFGAQRQAPSIVIERVILDASNVRQLSDLVDLFAALPQVARATAPSMGG